MSVLYFHKPSISEKKFKLSIEVFFLVVLRRKEKIGIWIKINGGYRQGTTPLLIIFYSFYLFVNNNILFFYITGMKKVEKC